MQVQFLYQPIEIQTDCLFYPMRAFRLFYSIKILLFQKTTKLIKQQNIKFIFFIQIEHWFFLEQQNDNRIELVENSSKTGQP